MSSKLSHHTSNQGIGHAILQTGSALLITHRVKATLGYNIAYFLILLALFGSIALIQTMIWELAALFVAVFLLKTQASLADVIHDYEVDKNNPEKSILADSVDQLGEQTIWSLLVVEIVVSLMLWGYLSVNTGEVLFLVLGATGILLGFMYSYPPRIKEWGIWNHVVTSGVDVMVVLLPAAFFIAPGFELELLPVFVLVFLYSFAYHVAHQAADTYYDRQSGISTFTQQIGVDNSTLLIISLFLLAVAVALHYLLIIAAVALAIAAWWFSYIFMKIAEEDEKTQTDYLASHFNIATWATALNAAVALNIALHRLSLPF